MLYFINDYSEGAHEKILQKFIETNRESLTAYGNDKYSASAKEKIKAACECPDAEVYFIAGGTQTNLVVIDTMLKSYESVIAAQSGHINCHEAGAVEGSGHKVIGLPQKNGKLNASDLEKYLRVFYADANHEHMTFPGMVYISHPTEYGTLYTKKEMTDISDICHRYNIPLFLDGARLGYGIESSGSELSLPDIARLCDVFYIGGTKVGALCGEAVVFTKKNRPLHFPTLVKQRGAMLAKGRLIGIQFDVLFTDGLYFEISKNAIKTAEKLRSILKAKGYRFFIETTTNQTFVILENSFMKQLAEKVAFDFWEMYDEDHTVVRFCTSWATTDEQINELEKVL